MNLRNITKKLISICEKEYGKHWAREIALSEGIYFSTFPSSYSAKNVEPNFDEFNKLLECHGYKLLGAGGSRLCFGYKNIVIKIDHKKEFGNKMEIKSYDAMKSTPIIKYFMCPLIKKMKIDKHFVLIYPKVNVKADITNCNHNKKMYNITNDLFQDIFECNVGIFCGGIVAVDLNCGKNDHFYFKTGKTKAKQFAQKYPDFWKKYVKNYKKTVKDIKKECCIV